MVVLGMNDRGPATRDPKMIRVNITFSAIKTAWRKILGRLRGEHK